MSELYKQLVPFPGRMPASLSKVGVVKYFIIYIMLKIRKMCNVGVLK